MAFEIAPWKKEGCKLSVMTTLLSGRETFSREINETYGEGGGLNANYRTVEAVAVFSGLLGKKGLQYGKDFIFKTGASDAVIFDFKDEATMLIANDILADKTQELKLAN